MHSYLKKFQEVAQSIETELNKKSTLKEKLLKLSRDLVKTSGKVISNVHSRRVNEAEQLLSTAMSLHSQIWALLSQDPSFTDSGYILTALQEFTEAHIFFSLISNSPIHSPTELNVTDQAYLLGIADVIGELRRHILEILINDNIEEAKRFFQLMKDLYDIFLQIEIDKSLISDFRRKRDMARVLIEKTLSDLFIAIQSKRLELKMKDLS